MKNIIATILFFLFNIMILKSQVFIEQGNIEFEVKTNIKKTMGDGTWAEMMKENLPTFKTAYYKFTFANNKSIFKLDHFDETTKIPDYMKKSDELNVWYGDFSNGSMEMTKNIFGSDFNIKDSLLNIQWKLSNENRIIAGFNCKKAIGKIFDSVYVFAFYTDEIMISGGPCSINGLPGMILGMTIPRLYTSWIATKVNVTNVNETTIQPVNAKKPFNKKAFNETLADRIKEWGSDEESKKWKEQFLWNAML